MSDIYQAVNKRTTPTAEDIKVDVVSLDEAKLFPAPGGAQQGEFSRLAAMLLEFKPVEGGLVLAFASNVSGEGASFVSYNVARLLALGLGRSTAWIDANFLSPQPKLQIREDTSFADLLRDPARAEAMVADGSRLAVVPGGHGLENLKAAMTARAAAGHVLAAYRKAYEFTVLDCPPIQTAVETSLLGAVADAMVVVVESRRLKHEVVAAGVNSLISRKVNVIGTVLNKRKFELPKAVYDRL